MKILVCTNHFSPSIGGCEIVTEKLSRYLVDRDHSVYVATRRIRGRNPSNYKKIRFIEYTPGDFRRFNIAVKEINPDLVIIYSDVFDFTRNIISEFKCRIIICLCGANWLHSNPNFVRIIYNQNCITDLVCHSEHDRDYKLCSNNKMLSKTRIIPNAIDTAEFDNNTKSRSDLFPEYSNHKWILNVSNFFPGKGQIHIPDILCNLPNKWRYLYLQVASDIDFSFGSILENEWKKECDIKLKDHKNIEVKLLKNISREKVVALFKTSNVFLFTSEKEVAPLVLIEAMYSELPWVSGDVGNAKGLNGGRIISTIKNSRFHSVFDERVKKLFASATESLLINPTVAKQGKKQAESLTWDKILPYYASMIER